ncbi:uncharacterized protein LOC106869368 [Octopus bimaculoides]|uniref:uncharacterized protein LOC106869368 n=1 Tax=Octopus bimaculoides TaxID=37653 RepID=UPI00071E5D8B|nr:uncharacterized protein LOC106869368 [Octopus bimaculoides]|eukprot:XP_014770577.1 PREDICTED: uncharacterized protein LOC106869368 [Octopus bimaculoides]
MRDLEDDARSGRSARSVTPENVEKIHQLVHEDRWSALAGNPYVELNMQLLSAKFVPYLLTTEQKGHRIKVYYDLRQRTSDDPSFMSRIIPGDESWVYGYGPEMKQ